MPNNTKLEASINMGNKRICIGLSGVIAGNYFLGAEKNIMRRMQFYFDFFMNIKIVTIFLTIFFIGTHSRSIG